MSRIARGKILLVDDEQTFLLATAQLLENEGFECDCAQSGMQAEAEFNLSDYDVVIADIKMPGNSELELIHKIEKLKKPVSVILVTGYPTQQTAIDAVKLPVVAYLLKPVDFPVLLEKLEFVMRINALRSAVSQIIEDLHRWLSEIESVETAIADSKTAHLEDAVSSIFRITAAGIESLFRSIIIAVDLLDENELSGRRVCDMVECSKLDELTAGLANAVDVLKKSKEAHRSKQLGEIRVKLEKLLKNIQKN